MSNRAMYEATCKKQAFFAKHGGLLQIYESDADVRNILYWYFRDASPFPDAESALAAAVETLAKGVLAAQNEIALLRKREKAEALQKEQAMFVQIEEWNTKEGADIKTDYDKVLFRIVPTGMSEFQLVACNASMVDLEKYEAACRLAREWIEKKKKEPRPVSKLPPPGTRVQGVCASGKDGIDCVVELLPDGTKRLAVIDGYLTGKGYPSWKPL